MNYDLDLKVTALDGVTSPFGAALIQGNIEMLKMVYDGLLGKEPTPASVQ